MELDHDIRPAVVLCPPLSPDTAPPAWVGRVTQALRTAGMPVLAPPPADRAHPEPGWTDDRSESRSLARWVADQASAIRVARLSGPLLLVAHGAAISGIPALAMSQRAARHNVVGYVIVDGPPPAPRPAAADWPDAPVLHVQSPTRDPGHLRPATLRGWQVARDDPAQALLAHARTWPDHV